MSLTTDAVTNVTDSTGNETRPYIRPFSDEAIVASTCILLPLMALSIFGNLITIVVISTSAKLKSVFNLFILSLCASDLTSAIISPLFLYRRTRGYDDWNIPDFLCKVYWAFDMWTSYVTALHILLFAILRLISIRWPRAYVKIKKVHARICIVAVWCVAFLTGFIPFAWWYSAGERRRNTDDMDARWPACTLDPEWSAVYSIYQKIAFPIVFYLPIVLVISLTITIGILLERRRRHRNAKPKSKITTDVESKVMKSARKEKEAMIQLSMIAGSFMLGYIPFTAYEISSMVIPSVTAADERFWWMFGMVEYICLRFSETLNPVFYNLASPKMRGETRRVLGRGCGIVRACCNKGIGRQFTPADQSSSDTQGLPKLNTLAYAEQAVLQNRV